MDITNLSESKTFRRILLIIIIILAALTIFQLGMLVGYRKAQFTNELGENYARGFGRPEMPGGHGAVGTIVRVDLPSIIIEGPDNLEKEVLVSSSTLIRSLDQNASTSALQTNAIVTIIGTPNNQGQIVANLIRIITAK
jgi:hypothetical protein